MTILFPLAHTDFRLALWYMEWAGAHTPHHPTMLIDRPRKRAFWIFITLFILPASSHSAGRAGLASFREPSSLPAYSILVSPLHALNRINFFLTFQGYHTERNGLGWMSMSVGLYGLLTVHHVYIDVFAASKSDIVQTCAACSP